MALLFDQYPSSLSQQAALQHQQALVPRSQTRQSQSPSMPNMPSGLLDQFMGGGSATGVGSSLGTSGGSSVGFGLGQPLVSGGIGNASFAGGSGAAAGGSGAGAATGGMGGLSSLGSMGPWAALVAAIGLNENYQKKTGNRDQGTWKQIEHALTGKVVEDDASVWGEKIDSGNKLGIKGDMEFATDVSTFDFSNAFKNLDETLPGKLFGGLF